MVRVEREAPSARILELGEALRVERVEAEPGSTEREVVELKDPLQAETD